MALFAYPNIYYRATKNTQQNKTPIKRAKTYQCKCENGIVNKAFPKEMPVAVNYTEAYASDTTLNADTLYPPLVKICNKSNISVYICQHKIKNLFYKHCVTKTEKSVFFFNRCIICVHNIVIACKC